MIAKAPAFPEQVSTFRVGRHEFALDILAVQEVLQHHECTPIPLSPPDVAGLINLRGRIVTTIDLRVRLGIDDQPSASPVNIVVQHQNAGPINLLADAIGDVVSIDASQVQGVPETVDEVTRTYVTSVLKRPQSVVMLLDVSRITSLTDAR